jgi:hypothetical protein
MDASVQLPSSVVLVIALLAIFLSFLVVLKYTVSNRFTSTRFAMTSFFLFVVATLSLSFWPYALATLPYTAPAFVLGLVAGYLVGVRGANERLYREGHAHYREHFAHIHIKGQRDITWWTFVNYYTVMGALVLINLVGISSVLVQSESLAIATSAVGAALLGSIAPYLVHLWSISATHHANSTTSDR